MRQCIDIATTTIKPYLDAGTVQPFAKNGPIIPASKNKPAKLLAVFVVDTDDKQLNTPL